MTDFASACAWPSAEPIIEKKSLVSKTKPTLPKQHSTLEITRFYSNKSHTTLTDSDSSSEDSDELLSRIIGGEIDDADLNLLNHPMKKTTKTKKKKKKVARTLKSKTKKRRPKLPGSKLTPIMEQLSTSSPDIHTKIDSPTSVEEDSTDSTCSVSYDDLKKKSKTGKKKKRKRSRGEKSASRPKSKTKDNTHVEGRSDTGDSSDSSTSYWDSKLTLLGGGDFDYNIAIEEEEEESDSLSDRSTGDKDHYMFCFSIADVAPQFTDF